MERRGVNLFYDNIYLDGRENTEPRCCPLHFVNPSKQEISTKLWFYRASVNNRPLSPIQSRKSHARRNDEGYRGSCFIADRCGAIAYCITCKHVETDARVIVRLEIYRTLYEGRECHDLVRLTTRRRRGNNLSTIHLASAMNLTKLLGFNIPKFSMTNVILDKKKIPLQLNFCDNDVTK